MKSRSLGVLILSPFFSPGIGGVETHLNDLCEFLVKRNNKVIVCTYQPLITKTTGPEKEITENLEIYRIKWPHYNLFQILEPYPLLEWIYLFPGLFFFSLGFLLKRHKEIDVIHTHGMVGAFITKILSFLFRKRCVVSTHAIYNLQTRSIMACLLKHILGSFDRIFTLSNQSKDELIAIGLNSKNLEVYTYWVDQDRFRPQNKNEAKKLCGWEGKFIVLFVGRLVPYKGVRLVADSATRLNKEIFIAIIGEGPLHDEIEQIAEKCKNIIFVGRINNKDLVKYYNAADLFVAPSMYEEGFGRVFLEALSCGTPVIGSNMGGIPEVIDPSVGSLIDPTVENLTREIELYYNSPQKLKNATMNARQYAERKFSDKNGIQIEKAYY